MEIVPNDPRMGGTVLNMPREPQAGPHVDFEDTLKAGFRQENDVLNVVNLLSRPEIPADPDFNVSKYGEEKYGDFWLNNYRTLGGAQSGPEMDALAARIKNENKDKELLASQGWSGLVAGMAAGVISPTMFIPLVGEARGVKGVAQTFALAASAASIQEAALFANQLTRDPEQGAISIAGATVLGGILGTAAKYLGRSDFEELGHAINTELKARPDAQLVPTTGGGIEREGVQRPLEVSGSPSQEIAAQTGGGSIGASVVDESMPHSSFSEATTPRGPGKVAPSIPGANKVIAQLSPVLRSVEQNVSPNLRQTMLRLSDDGVDMANNKFGIAHAPGGTVENRLGYYRALHQQAVQSAEDSYVAYVLKGAKPTLGQAKAIAVRKFFNSASDGNMKFSEFKEHITDALNTGDLSDIPEVQKAVDAIRKVYEKIWQAMEEAADERGLEPMLGSADLKEGESFLNHIYDSSAVATHKGEFIDEVSQWINNEISRDFNEQYDKLLGKLKEDDDVAKLLELGQEEAGKLYDDLKAQLGGLAHPAEADPVLDQAAGLRRQARALGDAEFERLEKRYNASGDPEITTQNRAAAARLTKQESDALRSEAKRLEENLPEQVKQTIEQRKALRRQMRLLNRSIGKRTTRQEEMQTDIARLEGRNIDTLEGLGRAFKRLDAGLEKWSDEKLDFQLKKMEEQFDALAQQIQKSEGKLEQLYQDLGTEFEPTERISIEEARNAVLRDRQAKILDKIPRHDRVALRAAVKEQFDHAIEYANKMIKRRHERQDALREKLKTADPQIAKDEARSIRNARQRKIDEFMEQATKKGAEQLDTPEGAPLKFGFAEKAQEIATKLANSITGASGRMGHLDTLTGERGAGLARYLNLPYEIKKKYLERDIEKVVSIYTRSMGPDIEMYRATGAVNGDGPHGLQAVRADLDRYSRYLQTRTRTKPDLVKEDGTVVPQGKEVTPAMREKDLAEFERQSAHHMNDLRVVIDRLRNVRGIPNNPDAWGYRAGRAMLNWNVSTMMGTAFLTSVPDASRSVMAHGLLSTFRDGYAPFVKGMISRNTTDLAKKTNIQRELKLMGIGIDTWLGSRAHAMLDIFDTYSRTTKPERMLEWTARMTPRVAMFGQWTDVMQSIAGAATMARLVRGLQDINLGRADADTIRYLATTGIDEKTARRIWKQMETPLGGTKYADWRKLNDPSGDKKYDDLVLPNTESWTDAGAIRAFGAAMHREVNRIIVAPGVGKPNWADESMAGRLMFQFRSFTFASTQKMLLSGLQQRDMALFNVVQGTMFSLALGSLSYYLYGLTVGGPTKDKMLDADWRTWADQAIYRSGMLGAFGEAQTIGGELPVLRPYLYFSDHDLAGRRPEGVLEAALGPSYSKAGTIATVAAGFDEPTQGTIKQMKQLVPWQNVWYLRHGLDQITQGASKAAGLPEKRS